MRFLPLALALTLAAAGALAQPTPPASTTDFEGTWLGTVTAPNAAAEIGFKFTRRGDALVTVFHMPAMFLHGANFGPAQLAPDGTLRFRPLDTTLRRDGDQLVGTFGLSHLPLELRRADAFPSAAPPPNYPAGPAPSWTAKLGGELWASPVVQDDTIYLGTSEGKFHAVDAASGRPRWTWTGPNPLYGAALITGDTVIFLDDQHNLVALKRADGTLAWHRPVHDASLAGAFKPNETYNRRTAVPVLRDTTLYLGSSDGGIYAITAATGGVRWRHDAKTRIYATAGLDGRELLFGGLDGTLLALDPQTRRETRRVKLPGPLSSTPVVVDDTVVIGCRNYMLYGLARSDLSTKWQFSFWFSWIESTPAVVDGTLYIGGSDFARISALDPATGRARWSTVVHGLTWGTPLIVENTVYAGTSAQNDAIIPHSGSVTALDRRTGSLRWRNEFPLTPNLPRAGVLGSLAATRNHLIVASFDGTLAAYPLGR